MKNNYWIVFVFIIGVFACKNNSSNDEKNEEENVGLKKKKVLVESPQWVATAYRNENWKPSQGQYFFSEMWTWTFHNEMLASDDPRHKGEMSIYVDPPSGTILLTRPDTKYQDEMLDWLIIEPSGKYIAGYTGEHGDFEKIEGDMTKVKDFRMRLSHQKNDFEKYFKQKETQKIFGANKYNNPTIEGQAYEMTFEKTNDKTVLYLAELPFSLRPFYLVAEAYTELGLPLKLDYGFLLPDNYLVLSEDYQHQGKSIGYQLSSFSAAEYFLNIEKYK